MSVPYIDIIFLGMVRVFFWILFIYVLKRFFYSGNRSFNQVKVLGYYWSLYGSILTILIFFLVLVKSFDLLTMLSILVIFFAFRLFSFDRSDFTRKGWIDKVNTILLDAIRSADRKIPIIHKAPIQKSAGRRFGIKTELLVMALAALLAVIARFILIQFDDYQLSSGWFEELSTLVSIKEQDWMSSKLLVTGEFGLMAFYSMMTGISSEMALESFAFIQIFMLSIMIFWFVDSITTSTVMAPLVAALTFGLFFNLTPLEIEEVTRSRQSLMAMTFLLPAMTYLIRPWKLYKERSNLYLISIFLIFMAIALIDFFTAFMLVPPLFAVSLILLRRKYLKYYLKAIAAYVLAVSIVLGYYYVMSLNQRFDFGLFVRNNLLSLTTSTTTSNMLVSSMSLLRWVQGISIFLLVFMLMLYRAKKNKWAAPIALVIYINVLILMSQSGFIYFDVDLFNEIIPVLLAAFVGVLYYVIYYSYAHYFKIYNSNWVLPPLAFIVFISLTYFVQRPIWEGTSEANTLSKNILEAYEMIKDDYLPNGYAVVNDYEFLPMSKGSHIFISNNDFIRDYPLRDSIFQANRKDEEFLKEHTEYILPNSVLVFVIEESDDQVKRNIGLVAKNDEEVKQLLSSLRQKGRYIRRIYHKENLMVYEIVNGVYSAKISELL
jgi:hypothetical protein